MKDPRYSAAAWWAWFVGLCLLVMLLPSAKFGVPFWNLPARELHSAEIIGAAFLLSAIAIGICLFRGAPLSRWSILRLTAMIFGIAFFAFVITGRNASMTVIIAMLGLALVLLPASFGTHGMHRFAVPAVYALSLAALGAAVHSSHARTPTDLPGVHETLLHSAYYNLSMVSYTGRIPRPAMRGGGLARIGKDYLLGTGDGYLYLFNEPSDDHALSVRKLPYRVPANGEEFAAYLGQPYGEPTSIATRPPVALQIESWQFRVAGMLVQELGDTIRVFASHHYWNAKDRCIVFRVSMLEAARATLLAGTAGPNWRTIYETHPCIHIGTDTVSHQNPFTGEEIGGRMALLDDKTMLLTLGDLGFSGETTPERFSQDPSVSYGKIQMIPLDGGPAQAFDMGHRNMQGLFIDPQGVIWSTEHGPQGGDELNRIVRGANYGWPNVTYGTQYGSLAWPLNPHQGRHDGYEKPVYSWIPSIGPSNLIEIQKNLFDAWRGDLIVGSLKSQSLWRVRLEDGHTVLTERIETPRRIRDLMEADDGHLIVWSDDATLDFIQPVKGTENGLAFATMCSGCHAVEDGETQGLGPDLRGVFGRHIASAKGFNQYSAALRQKSGNWDEKSLNAFLTSPQDFAPGTAMAFSGIKDPATRAEIIQYLKNEN